MPRSTRQRRRAVPLAPEMRAFRAEGIEVRELAETNEIILRGRPIVYDRPEQPCRYRVVDALGEFTERVLPGAVSAILDRNADVALLVGHDQSGLPLARTTSGTLTLRDTPTALTFEARMDARMQLANDVSCAVSRGDLGGLSIGFQVGTDSWGVSDDGGELRTISSIRELIEISCVAFPCSTETSVAVAQRMMAGMGVESRARVRRALVNARANDGRLSRADLNALSALMDDPPQPDPAEFAHIEEKLAAVRSGRMASLAVQRKRALARRRI